MRWKTTALLAALLIGLGTFFYVYEVRQGPAREKASTEKDRLFKGLEVKDIEEVRLRRGGELLHLRKAADGWTVVTPVAANADGRAVDDLLAALASARVEREIDPNPAKLGDFGLEPPAVEATLKAKGEERSLRLGAKSPTGIWVYAQEVGKSAVFLAPDSLLRETQKGVAEFRDRTVLAFERKDVKGLEVRPVGGPTLRVEAKGEGWQMTAPREVPADREQVASLLEKLRGARIREFVSPAPAGPGATPPKGPIDPYGLERPLTVTLWLGEEKERVAKSLRLGKGVPDKKAIYAQREGESAVFLVDEDLLRAVPTTALALRDKTVFAYDRGKLERVELESPKGTLTMTLEGGAWRITSPISLRVDESAMNTLLARARELRAKDIVAEPPARLAQFGLDRPQVRLAVWEKDAKEPRALLLGPAAGKDGRAYATTVASGAPAPVVLVDATALAELGRSVQELRDHALFEAFDTRDVTRVQIARGETTLVLERRGEEDWQLVAPRKGKARGQRVNDLVWALRNLKWRDLLGEQGAEFGRHGLEPPGVTITLSGKDGKTLAALALGRREAAEAFVRVPGQPQLYAIEAKHLGDLPLTSEDLLL